LRPIAFTSASTLALFVSTAAFAADAVYVDPAPVAPIEEVAVFSWTGGYIGIQGGYVWTGAELDDGTDILDDEFNGGMVGGFVGYNWQSGAFVFGGEADLNAVFNDETFEFLGEEVDVGTDYLASIRGRVGYAWDRTLLFGTAGVAFTEASAEATIAGIDFDASESFVGWTIGAGLEYAFTDNWLLRGEYRYYDFGNEEIGEFENVDLDFNTVSIGVAYKF
jgi:outer membrane immunogenic protein